MVYEVIRTEVKTVKAARAAFERLNTEYVKMVGDKQAEHEDSMWKQFHGINRKENGLAWWKDRVLSAANSIVHKASVRQFVSAPSPESKAWDSFEGGHNEVYTDQKARVEAETVVAVLIRAA